MKVKLVCSEESKADMIGVLESKGIEISDDAEFILYEKDYSEKQYFTGKRVESISLIPIKEIVYFEALNNDAFCLTIDEKYSVKEKLYQIEEMLMFNDFIRISKSHLINIHMISEIIPWIGSKYILKMKNGDKLDVNRTYYSNFKKKIGL